MQAQYIHANLDIYDVFVTIDEVIEESKRMFSKIESFHHVIKLDRKSSVLYM